MKTILALPGSLRRHSFNRLLLDAASRNAPSELSFVRCDVMASIPLFDEDLEAQHDGGPEPVRRLRRAVSEADGLLIATPEYNWSIPGVLKNAIDWLSRPAPEQVLIGKPVAILGASAGGWGTRLAQAALRQVLASTESLVLPAPALFVRNAASVFDESGRLVDPGIKTQLTELLRSFDIWIDQTAPHARHPAGQSPGEIHV